MNPISELMLIFRDAFRMVYEALPWLFPVFLCILMLSILGRMLIVFFSVLPVDPQDQDGTCPPGPVLMPGNRSTYDPEHWYTGKD